MGIQTEMRVRESFTPARTNKKNENENENENETIAQTNKYSNAYPSTLTKRDLSYKAHAT